MTTAVAYDGACFSTHIHFWSWPSTKKKGSSQRDDRLGIFFGESAQAEDSNKHVVNHVLISTITELIVSSVTV
jgi:hypothetical protein